MMADYVAVRLSNAEEETLRLAAIIEQLRADQERMRETLEMAQRRLKHHLVDRPQDVLIHETWDIITAALSTPRQP